MVDFLDERMRGEKFGKAAAKGACAVAVDDADGWLAGEGGLVDEFVDAAGGFFDRGADYVDFFGGGLVAWLRVNGDAAGARGRQPKRFSRVGAVLNSDDIGQAELSCAWGRLRLRRSGRRGGGKGAAA